MAVEVWLPIVLQAVMYIGVPAVLAFIAVNVKDQKTQQILNDAVGRAAGLVYARMSATGSQGLAEGLRTGTAYLQERIPDTLDAKGLKSAPDVQRMLEGEVGKLLAADPNTTTAQTKPAATTLVSSGPTITKR